MVQLEITRTIFIPVGWTLLHFLWQGAAIAILTRGALFLFRKQAARTRYLILCGSLLLMLSTPIITFWTIETPNRTLNISETELMKSGQAAFPENKLENSSDIDLNRRTLGPAPVVQAVGNQNIENILPWIVDIWLIGILIFSARLIFDLSFVRKMKTASSVPLPELTAMLEKLTGKLRIEKSVRLFESSMVKVPVIVGWLKPLILLPVGAAVHLSPLVLESVIAHELAHIRRHDYLINILQTIAEILLFYHPAVLWVSRQIRAEREYACDDLALAVCGGDGINYARALAKVERFRKMSPVLAMGIDEGDLKSRVRRLVDKSYRPAPGAMARSIFVLPAAFAAGMIGWQSLHSNSFPGNLEAQVWPVQNTGESKQENKPDPLGSERFEGEDEFLRSAAISALGKHTGTVIIMNPQTGRLYTIVNQDLALRTEWTPASTFKLITSLAALEKNDVQPDEKIRVDRGVSLNLSQALQISKNEYFTEVGERVGTDDLLKYAKELGLGRPTGVSLGDEAAGYLPDRRSVINPRLLGMAGEKVRVTPIQLAVLASAMANGGVIVVPFAGKPEDPPRSIRSMNVSSDSIAQVVKGMKAVVRGGTGSGAFNPSLDIAGKTGTATDDNDGVGLFTSFAPIENPKFVVVVAIKEPEAMGFKAAEIAGKIYRVIGQNYRSSN